MTYQFKREYFKEKVFWQFFWDKSDLREFFRQIVFNRCRRGLETCPQANLAKMSHAIFFSFFPTGPSDEYDSAPSQKYTGQFVPLSPVSVKRIFASDYFYDNFLRKAFQDIFCLNCVRPLFSQKCALVLFKGPFFEWFMLEYLR